jgi:hypothetical protein
MLNANQKKAVKELSKLKVCAVMNDDINWNDFEEIFYSVAHETDLYEEEQDSNCLTKSTYLTAKKWLNKHSKLNECQ